MSFVSMKISGITIDNDMFYPLIILKNEETKQNFPLSLTVEEKNTLLYAVINRENPYSSLIYQLLWQQNMSVERVTIEETDKEELVSVIYIKNKHNEEKLFLYPVEGVILALEFGIEVSVSDKLLKSKKHFTKKAQNNSVIQDLSSLMFDTNFPFDTHTELKGKKETLQ